MYTSLVMRIIIRNNFQKPYKFFFSFLFPLFNEYVDIISFQWMLETCDYANP